MVSFSRKSKILILNLGLLLFAIFLVWLSPSEKTLGGLVKLVYVHAAIVSVALFTFMVAGILGVVYLITSRKKIYLWLCAFQKTAFLFWIIYFLSSIVLTYLAWGAIGWMEPRFQLAIQILILVSLIFLFSLWIDQPKTIAFLNLGLFILIFYRTSTVQRIFHPSNPIGKSNSFAMKFYTISIILTLVSVAFITAYLMLPLREEITELREEITE